MGFNSAFKGLIFLLQFIPRYIV